MWRLDPGMFRSSVLMMMMMIMKMIMMRIVMTMIIIMMTMMTMMRIGASWGRRNAEEEPSSGSSPSVALVCHYHNHHHHHHYHHIYHHPADGSLQSQRGSFLDSCWPSVVLPGFPQNFLQYWRGWWLKAWLLSYSDDHRHDCFYRTHLHMGCDHWVAMSL